MSRRGLSPWIVIAALLPWVVIFGTVWMVRS
jgi:hypothetical protein